MCEPRDDSGGDDERSKSMHVLVISITKVKKYRQHTQTMQSWIKDLNVTTLNQIGEKVESSFEYIGTMHS